jgi:hypothetical protein
MVSKHHNTSPAPASRKWVVMCIKDAAASAFPLTGSRQLLQAQSMWLTSTARRKPGPSLPPSSRSAVTPSPTQPKMVRSSCGHPFKPILQAVDPRSAQNDQLQLRNGSDVPSGLKSPLFSWQLVCTQARLTWSSLRDWLTCSQSIARA